MSSQLVMMDTNTVSFLMREKDAKIKRRLMKQGIRNICISSITEAELLYGLRLSSAAKAMRLLVTDFLTRVDSLEWDSGAAECYAEIRYQCKSKGVGLSNMDMLIAAHSMAADATLVTNDNAFSHVPKGLIKISDWTK